jgi:hypothetical protein
LGLARVRHTREEYIESATQRIMDSRRMLRVLMRENVIAPMPSVPVTSGDRTGSE